MLDVTAQSVQLGHDKDAIMYFAKLDSLLEYRPVVCLFAALGFDVLLVDLHAVDGGVMPDDLPLCLDAKARFFLLLGGYPEICDVVFHGVDMINILTAFILQSG